MLQSSLDYVHIPIKGRDAAKITASMISVTFADAVNGPWVPADGYTYDATRGEWPGIVEILVGPGSTIGQLAAGRSAQAYVQINAAPTRPALKAKPGPYITTS